MCGMLYTDERTKDLMKIADGQIMLPEQHILILEDVLNVVVVVCMIRTLMPFMHPRRMSRRYEG